MGARLWASLKQAAGTQDVPYPTHNPLSTANKKLLKKPMSQTYEGKSTRPGGGGRFAMAENALMGKGMSKDRADAIAASQGRKKYGAARFAQMAAAGRKRSK